MKPSRIIVLIVAAGGLALAGCAAPSANTPAAAATSNTTTADPSASHRIITARGIGNVTGTPDTVTIDLGVETKAPSASDALSENNGKATALIEMLKSKGVKSEDLQTSELSIYPTYNDKTSITGYRVTNSVTATLHDINGAGALIDAAQQIAGDAIRVNSLGFSIDDDSKLRADARADAVRLARAQAQQMADAAGVKLGAVESISEVPATQSPVMRYPAAQAADSAAPIEAGTQELSVSVELVFSIG